MNFPDIKCRMRDCVTSSTLHGHLHVDLGMGIVVLDEEVVEGKVLDACHLSLELERGEGARGAQQLLLQWLHVRRVDVCIAQRVHKVAGL